MMEKLNIRFRREAPYFRIFSLVSAIKQRYNKTALFAAAL